MKILMLMPQPGRAGAAKVFEQHANDFGEIGTVQRAYFRSSPFSSNSTESAVIKYIDSNNLLSKLGALGRFVNRIFALRSLSNEIGADVMISHMDGANFVNGACPSKRKKILVVHGTTRIWRNKLGFFRKNIRHWATIICYRRAELVVAVSKDLALELRTTYGLNNVITIENYLDVLGIRSKAERPSVYSNVLLKSDRIKLVSHGRLTPDKNLEFQIKILNELKKRRFEVSLILVGDGADYDNLRSLCQKLNLSTHNLTSDHDIDALPDVCFINFVENPFSILSNCDIFLLTSRYEGFPLSLCEAIICGLPVVAADCPTGPKEILLSIDPGNAESSRHAVPGIIMPFVEGDSHLVNWANQLSSLMEDKERLVNFREASLEKAELFSRDKKLSQWKGILSESAWGLNGKGGGI